jgi:hypothetical protein
MSLLEALEVPATLKQYVVVQLNITGAPHDIDAAEEWINEAVWEYHIMADTRRVSPGELGLKLSGQILILMEFARAARAAQHFDMYELLKEMKNGKETQMAN